jgi:soluble lytic murein transglycosylase-like protein
MKVLMELLIRFSQTRAGNAAIRIRSLDGYALAFVLAFAVAAQAEPRSLLDQCTSEGAISISQDREAKLAQSTPTETSTRGIALNAAVHPSIDAICDAIASAATSNNLPLAFFTRLIWQESRFDPLLVSSKGARGIAQFMPATASWRGLKNPFDPIAAIPKAAQLLNELWRAFGNIGPAADNAGPEGPAMVGAPTSLTTCNATIWSDSDRTSCGGMHRVRNRNSTA